MAVLDHRYIQQLRVRVSRDGIDQNLTEIPYIDHYDVKVYGEGVRNWSKLLVIRMYKTID